MREIVLLITILLGINGYCQKSNDFRPGVEVIQFEKMNNFKTPESILFVFKGNTHLINNFLDLKKRINRKFRKTTVAFNYDLTSKYSLQSDLESIPKNKYSENKFEAVCYISILNINSWDNHLIKKRKQNYHLISLLKNTGTEKANLKLVLNVNSFFTITTQNKNLSKFIFQKIMKSKLSLNISQDKKQ